MSKELTRYECLNKTCTLGSRVTPGVFTGGMTADHLALLTGEPLELITDGKTIDPVTSKPYAYGEGVCPNCGTPGKKLEEPHVIEKGHDPQQPLHDKIAARVADEKDDLTADDAQAALEELTAKKPSTPIEGSNP